MGNTPVSPDLSETYVPPVLDPVKYMRSQADTSEAHAAVSALCDIECIEEGARQEFKDDADINVQIQRILRGEVPDLRPLQYGEVDFDLDYQAAQQVVKEATRAYDLLPLAIRQRFPSWQALAAAMEANPELFNTTGAGDGVSPSPEPVEPPAGSAPAAAPSPAPAALPQQ